MLRRSLVHTLALSLYLFGQAAAVLHTHEPETSCKQRSESGPQWTTECTDNDCQTPSHHHHPRPHDPASCRSCSGAMEATLFADEGVVELPLIDSRIETTDLLSRAFRWYSDRLSRGPPSLRS